MINKKKNKIILILFSIVSGLLCFLDVKIWHNRNYEVPIVWIIVDILLAILSLGTIASLFEDKKHKKAAKSIKVNNKYYRLKLENNILTVTRYRYKEGIKEMDETFQRVIRPDTSDIWNIVSDLMKEVNK